MILLLVLLYIILLYYEVEYVLTLYFSLVMKSPFGLRNLNLWTAHDLISIIEYFDAFAIKCIETCVSEHVSRAKSLEIISFVTHT